MKTIATLMALATVALSGCSSSVSPEKSARIDPQKTGLVLVTLIRTGPGEAPKNTRVEFSIRRVDGPESSFRIPDINSSKELWLVEVPVGRYHIADWHVATTFGRGEVAEHPYQFEVQPGQVTYIGRLEVAVVPINNKQGQRMFTMVQPVLENHYGRALTAFRQQYPALASVQVVNAAPAKLVAWNPVGRSRTYLTTSTVSSMGDQGYKTDFPPPLNTTPRMLSPY